MALSRRSAAALTTFGVFTLIALAFASSNYATYTIKHEPVSAWDTFGYSATEWYLWALMCPLIFAVVRRFPLTGATWLRRLPMYLLTWAGCHLVVVSAYIVMERQWGTAAMQVMPMRQLILLYVTKKIAFNLLVFTGIAVVAHAIDLYQRYRERERRALQLETQLTKAQLEALKNQLHPHFLFNTLNTISALLHRDVESADRVVSRLGDLLRLSLQEGQQEVTLRQELTFLQHYLDIQHTRFQDRLSFVQRVDPETLDAMVPSLILQPLVENAVRHGIEPRSTPGQITISARRDNGQLTLEVGDNGQGVQSAKTAGCAGIGLANTRARLEQLYGTKHRFTFANRVEGGVLVTMEFPFRRAGTPPPADA
jgi:two-component system, LytTR family, sensor kinase